MGPWNKEYGILEHEIWDSGTRNMGLWNKEYGTLAQGIWDPGENPVNVLLYVNSSIVLNC